MPLACSRRTFLTAAATLALAPAGAEPVSGPRLLEAREGSLRLLPDFAPATPIWGFDGVAPGPLLRARQNDELTVRLANRLDKPMSVHWHGLRGDNAMDGVAPLTQAPIAPGAQFDYRCKTSDAGLFCYRPSVWGLTSELMGRGLKGLLIIDEPHPAAADVDLATVLDDWRLNADGKIEGGFDDAAPAFSAGRIGALVTVNGKPAPSTHDLPPGGRVRLRLANLANARIMIVSFDGVQPFVLAVDSQPCDAFEPLQRTIPLAPGARFEIMFDAPAQEGARASMILRGQGEADRSLLVFTTKGAKAPERDKIASAPQNLLLPAEIKLAASKKIDLVIEPPRPDASAATTAAKSWMINGASSRAYDGAPLFQVKRGTPVTLGFNNRAGVAIVMHVHGHAVRLLHDLDDGWEPYWRNGVVVPGGKTKHVAFVADNPGKWALHDDILEHEASGLATWFEVT